LILLSGVVAFADSCSTAKCHPDIAKGKVAHEPVRVGECENCHQANSPVHPSGKGADFSLAATGNALCFACHDSEDFIGKYEHGPSVSGSCLYCHSPHNANYKKLLRKSPQDTCFSCHDDFGKSLQEAAFVHSAIDELDCGACHDPHASSIPRLLKGETTTLCLKCHDDIETKYKRSLQKHEPLYSGSQCANCHSAHFADYQALLLIEGSELCLNCHGDKNNESTSALRNIREEIEDKLVIHPPIEDEGCSGCHDPHGSGHDALLNGPYPGTVYAPYDEDAYDLCFQCHDKELLTSRDSESATDFRNGSLNLHNLHVAIERKGRTCKACHMSHGSDGEKLINPEGIPFGSWKIPVRFEMTENGGSCIPGCHQGMVYDREEAYDNSKKNIEEEE
jgi:predicted CXXCH cytochrome family protein